MKNSIKQMMRTPVRTVCFFLLLAFSALMMTLGASLWIKNEQAAAEYEAQFVTIGTVSQKAKSFEQTMIWDAQKKDYWLWKRAQYDSYYTVEDLLFPGAEYLAEPEQRAYYGSWVPEYVTMAQASAATSNGLLAEFSPLEDCRPKESVQIKITKVWGGNESMENSVVFFCDHENPEPDMLYKDKTYAARLGTSAYYAHGKKYEQVKASSPIWNGRLEYVPFSMDSSLYYPDGSQIEDEFRDGPVIYEVTEDFYETDAGKRLLDLAETEGYTYYTQPVTGTNKTCLLMPFYNGDSYLWQGRDIKEEEYAQGSKVCLAPRSFMENNQLSLGDPITVRLFYTNTRRNAGWDFGLDGGISDYTMIDEQGNRLEPFEISEYTVVGIYNTRMNTGDYAFSSGADELIVPMKSIESGNEKNLVSCGPMTDATTSFQIPNGSIEEFQKGWAKYGTPDLEITFHDMGYSQLKAGMENMRNLSLFFLIVGILLTGLLLFFFSHLFITKQAKRTAIERSLGMSRGQCRWSLLSGLLLLVILGSALGAAGGGFLSRKLSAGHTGKVYYDSTYTVGTTGTKEELMPVRMEDKNGNMPAFCCGIIIILAGAGISFIKMKKSLRREPMELLGEMHRES